MARGKEIEGTIGFSAVDASSDSESRQIFNQFVDTLSQRFRVAVEANLGVVTSTAVRKPPGVGAKVQDDKSVATPTYETVPFTVALTFRERGIEPFRVRFAKGLWSLLKRLGDYAGPAGIAAAQVAARQPAAALSTVLGAFLKEHAGASEAADLAKAASNIGDSSRSFSRSGAENLFKRWQSELKNLNLGDVKQDDWEKFINQIKQSASEEKPGTAAKDRGPDAPTPRVGDVKANDVAPIPPKFELTQLLGWLIKTEDQYKFRVEGSTRFEDDAVEYGDDARFDILGPDGSQLITRRVSRDDLSEWLVGRGKKDVQVKIQPGTDLRRAFERQSFRGDQAKFSHSVRGRFWFSDGSPFGIRTIAFFAPPAFSTPIDQCSADGEFASEDPDCCSGDGEVRQQVIRAPQALAVTQTDEAGYFAFSYVRAEPITANNALVQISGIRAALAVGLIKAADDQAGGSAGNSFPNPILLQVDAALISSKSPTATGAIEWEDKSQDTDECGCQGLAFGDRNRAIDEFQFDIVVRTTDPMVTRGTLDIDGTASSLDLDQRSPDALFRRTLGREDPIEWDGSPRITQAVTVSHGRVLSLKQIWRSDGYSLGDLLYSLPLAPLQKKNIAVIDWDRRSGYSIDSAQSVTESLSNVVIRDRDISEIANSLFNESLRGRSDSGGNSSSAGGGFSFLGIGFGGASGGSSSAWSSSSQDSTRSLAANFLNSLRDNTTQAANALRGQRVTTVQQISQHETATTTSETVANRNACHAITIQYFEVLRHVRADYELAAVRECLYVPMPISRFNADKVMRWRDSVQSYLPTRSLVDALDACARLQETPYPGPSGAYADEVVNDIDGELELTLDFPYPLQKLDGSTWQAFFGFTFFGISPLASLFEQLKLVPEDKRPAFFEANVAPVLAGAAVSSLTFTADLVPAGSRALPLEATLVTPYRAGGRHSVSVRSSGDIRGLAITRRQISGISLSTEVQSGSSLSAIINGIELRSATDHLNSKLVSRQNEDLGIPWQPAAGRSIPVRIATPLRPEELANPRVEDQRAENKLLRHLNEHVEFYHKAIWWRMDPDRRFTILDGYIAPNAGGRSIASVVENRLVALIGNCLVMPVAPGIRLDYYDEVVEAADEEEAKDLRPKEARESTEDRLLSLYRPLIQIPSTSHAIPTKGVFAESVMGNCNSCERMDDRRNWKYWEHPLPDEPTAIQPISLESRARKEDPQTPTLPTPIINQVANTLPAAPDPTGLGKIIEAITKNPGFADAMGLTGTQQNARDALSQSYSTTTKFGELAADITKQLNELASKAVMAYLTGGASALTDLGGASSIKSAIGKDAAAGRVTPEQAQRSIAKVNDALADALSPAKSQSVLEHPEVAAAIGAAADRGSPLSVAKGDTRVDVGSSPSGRPNDTRWPWPFRLFLDNANAASTTRPSAVEPNANSWIAKQFDIVSSNNSKRVIGLTLSLVSKKWSASDPRGIIDPDEGTWQSNNYINTPCLAGGRVVVDLVGCGILNVVTGQSGVANVPQSNDDFTWRCTKVIS